MTEKEKAEWYKVLSVIWGVPLWFILITQWAPRPDHMLIAQTIIAPSATVIYLLILSWRLAYLTGRKKR